ncbi:RNA polymerase factor sigma-54 [Natronospira bacteriovora]|uniref:RNA polymerase sigma-54 factor n=1 Tax=Natronospira bacteriovora TaxID=3069753 RepID=A0ABU0W6H3_9GAMM|nr:RNA polymerase factor sigma-54 [Natronospira sp. AB-CW4]MDQ2069539.1 RNA polymerase factor sigma-54 [Natronospira sp. AB-CW4]
MLKPALQLKIGQKLAMTPQLQQAIRLLQLSSLELETEIRQALDSNVMLEAEEELDSARDATDDNSPAPDQTASEVETRFETPDYFYSTGTGGGWQEDIDEDRRSENAEGTSLHDHLHWQLDMASFSEADRRIAEAVIDGIDGDGYLRESLDDLRQALDEEAAEAIEDAEIEMVIRRIQCFDPAGVGARSLRECLNLQLQALAREGADVRLAETLVEEHLEALARQPADKLANRLDCDVASVQAAISLIRSLHPHPGTRVAPATTEYVVPDVVVRRHEGRWVVELNSDITPSLRVNRLYADLVAKRQGGGEFQTMRGQLQEARWLVRSLEMRNDTLLRVASAIVEHQQAFLDQGEEHMKPLVLAEIAEAVDLHESTISRVTTRKYMLTPRGVFEFKYFFSAQLAREDGGETSATAVRARIKRMIAAENPAKPLSDSRLADDLKQEGFRVARRTVAKYREGMNIPPSHERKRVNA